MALIALTIMLTIFSVIEPLRKQQGMTIGQVLSFFGYMMPFMLSLTMPISALFAATITYGRFSQDNELLACRASGISTMSLLKPALILGVFVTAVSLILSNYVAPEMIKRSFATLNANPKGLVYRQLEHRSYYHDGDNFIHADDVTEEQDRLHGLVFVKWGGLKEAIEIGDKARITGYPHDQIWHVRKINPDATCDMWIPHTKQTVPGVPKKDLKPLPKERDVKFMIASEATVRINEQAGDDPFLDIDFKNLGATRSRDGAGNMLSESRHQGLRFDMPNPLKDKAAWLNWEELLQTIANPIRNPSVIRELEKIRLDLLHDHFMQDLAASIKGHKEYRSLGGQIVLSASQPAVERQFVVKADTIQETAGRRPKLSLGARLTNSDKSPVRMEIWENGLLRQTISSMPGNEIVVGVEFDEFTATSQVYLSMPGQVDVKTLNDPQVQRREDFSVGQLTIPEKLQKEVAALEYEQIYTGKDLDRDLTTRPSINKAIAKVQDDFSSRLLRDVIGELNSRLAYSSSCLLMVLLGSALGLIFKGGQFITAFAIAAVPGSLVIIMLLMGKGIMQNIKVPQSYGLTAIWGGIALLSVATCAVYFHLARK